MLTSSDFAQALRPAFIVYALAMASTGAALRFAPAEARQAGRAPAGLQWVERWSSVRAHSAHPVAQAAAPSTGLSGQAADCAGATASSPPPAVRRTLAADTLAGLRWPIRVERR